MLFPTDKELALSPLTGADRGYPDGYSVFRMSAERVAQVWLAYNGKPISWAYMDSGIIREAFILFAWRHAVSTSIELFLKGWRE